MAACDGPRCGPHHHALPCARSLRAWCVLAYVSVREKKPHAGEQHNVLVVRNLRIIRKYDANMYDRIPTVSQKYVQYSYMYLYRGRWSRMYTGIWNQVLCCMDGDQSSFWVKNFVLLPSSFSFYKFLEINILSQYSLVFGKNKISNYFFGETVSLYVSIPGWYR